MHIIPFYNCFEQLNIVFWVYDPAAFVSVLLDSVFQLHDFCFKKVEMASRFIKKFFHCVGSHNNDYGCDTGLRKALERAFRKHCGFPSFKCQAKLMEKEQLLCVVGGRVLAQWYRMLILLFLLLCVSPTLSWRTTNHQHGTSTCSLCIHRLHLPQGLRH